MSIPLNPLDNYRTYSYHHVLMVGMNTEAIRRFEERLDLTNANNLLTDKRLGEPIYVDKSTEKHNAIYLIADTRRVSTFMINDVQYSSLLGAGSPNQTQIIAGDVDMDILDPSGIAFINYLKFLCDDVFETEFFGLTFLLKTIFVGHTDQGTVTTVSTSSVPLLLRDMSINVSHTGGKYSLKFLSLVAGAQTAIPGLNNVPYAVTFKGRNLGEMVDNIQNTLNENCRKWFNEINRKDPDGREGTRVGRLVQYMFTLPGDLELKNAKSEKWRDFQLTGVLHELKELDHKNNANKKTNTTNTNAKSDGEIVSISASENMSIYDIIAQVMSACPQAFKKLSFESVEKGLIKRYKTRTCITSDDESITVHFDITEQTIPDVRKGETRKIDQGMQLHFNPPTKDGGEWKPKNSIEFDYIFSGKNTDIIDFQILVQNAWLTLVNSLKTSTDSVSKGTDSKKQPNEIKTDKKKQIEKIGKYTPIVAPVKTGAESRAFSSLSPGNESAFSGNPDSNNLTRLKQESLKTLADLHAVSSQDAKMSIRGNPDLMNKVLEDFILPHVKVMDKSTKNLTTSNTFKVNDVNEYKKALTLILERSTSTSALTSGPNVLTMPLFAKVNIFGPSVDIFGNAEGKKFARQYWYDGWYMVRTIQHKFTDGSFVQTLTMGAVELFNKVGYTANKDDKEKK